jgi:hypothetical protein
MILHIAHDHLGGGLYSCEEDEIDQIDIYCETCGDSDDYLGEFDNVDELKKYCKINFWYSYSDEYLENLFKEAQK